MEVSVLRGGDVPEDVHGGLVWRMTLAGGLCSPKWFHLVHHGVLDPSSNPYP